MRKITKNLLLLLMAFSVLTIVSCSDDEEEVFGGDDPNDPVSEFAARLNTASSDGAAAGAQAKPALSRTGTGMGLR